MTTKRRQQAYDHRLVLLVRETRDPTIATRAGVPRSTAAGWLKHTPRPVTSATADSEVLMLRSRVARLEKRAKRLVAFLRILLALLRILKPDLARVRASALDKARVLRAVHRSRGVRGIRRVLARFGLSASRLRSWRKAEQGCALADQPSCPGSSPQRLTSAEVSQIRAMVTSPQYRHVPTTRLALLAQRLALVFVSSTTWHRLVREHSWRRPRLRVHPEKPEEGIRATRPNEVWHIDTTILRLLDNTRVYLHAIIDNYSRRILAWRLHDRFDVASSVAVLVEACRPLDRSATPPTLLADAGVENKNAAVDELVAGGLFTRVLAQIQVRQSNSMIEAWWRSLKHQWLYLNPLDSLTRVRALVEFYVGEHNSRLPHGAFQGQTPDEMYLGTGVNVPAQLATRRTEARRDRMEANRALRCTVCA